MTLPVRGRVHGSSIELEEPLPELEGQRVLVLVEPEGPAPSRAELSDAWEDWVKHGPQGPIEEDDAGPEFP